MFNKTNTHLVPMLLILLTGLVLLLASGCDLSKEPSTKKGGPNAVDGRTFYDANCSVCHSAGQDDPGSAFNAKDLVSKAGFLQSDLSGFGDIVIGGTTYSLMEKFNAVPQGDIDNLKAYLGSL